MVSIGLSATDRSFAEQASTSPSVEACNSDASWGEAVNQLSAHAMQMGSVGALVALGVLGGASGAQATIRRGAQCEAVDRLQVALGDRGYEVGGVDGKFGGRTEAAVRRFQQQQQLQADGIVGPATARAMGLPPEFSCSFAAAKAVQQPVAWSPEGEFAVTTNGGDLNLRKAPAGPVVGSLKNGERVTVIGMADGWARLSSGAWVSRAWLQVGQRAKKNGLQNQQQPIAQSGSNADVLSQETTLIKSRSSQRIEPPSPESTQLNPRTVVEPKVAAAPRRTGKIAVSLPNAELAVEKSHAAASPQAVAAAKPAEIEVVADPAVAASPLPRASINQVSTPSLDLEPSQMNSRVLLVAAASDSISLPKALAPESTPLEIAEPTLSEPLIAAEQPSDEALPMEEPAVVAVRSPIQSMEVATYGDRLLIRDNPGGQVIGSIPNGLKISTLREKDGWYELETGGWVMARWLRS